MIALGRYRILGVEPSVVAILSMAIGAGFTALSEELVFRGYLVRILQGRSQAFIAVVTALLFVALHLPRWGEPMPYFIGLFFKGLFYAILVLKSSSIWAAIGHHWAWNFTYFLFFGYEQIFSITTVAPVGGSVSLWVAVGLAPTAPLVGRLLVADNQGAG